MKTEWSKVSLGDLLRLERRPVKVHPEGQYREIGIYCFGRGIFHKMPRTGFEVGDKNLFLLKEGDFILQVTFAWEGAVAVVSAAEDGMYGSTRFPTFRVDKQRCVPKFLMHYFKTEDGRQQLVNICPGSAGRNRVLSIKRIPEVLVPLPPLEEQRRVVELIEKLAARVEEGQKLRLQAMDEAEKLPATMLRTLQSNSDVKPTRLGTAILSSTNGLSRRPVGTEHGPIVLRLADVGNGEVDLSNPRRGNLSDEEQQKYSLQAGDLLFVRVNGSRSIVGRCVPVRTTPEFTCYNDHLIRVRVDPKLLDWKYASLVANGPQSRSYIEAAAITTAGQLTVNQKMIEALPLQLPPLSEQHRIVARLDELQRKTDSLRALQVQTSAEFDALIPSILDKAFRGEL